MDTAILNCSAAIV